METRETPCKLKRKATVKKLNVCCDKLQEEILVENMLFFMQHRPFYPMSQNTAGLYILSDGGHGGCIKAEFCPFCGKKIEFK